MINVKSFKRKSRNNYVNLNLIIILKFLKFLTNEPVLSVKVSVPAGPLPMLFTANT